MTDIAIRAQGVSKKYRLYESPMHRLKEALHPLRRQFHRDFWALKNVSFDVVRGQSVGVIGRNGSGKSTLLQILSGVLQPSDGKISSYGRISALLELGAGFNPEVTGRENVYMNGAILGIDPDEMKARFPQIADFADIGFFIDQPVKTYSSGMYVRLAFAVAANIEPDILIIDEALAVGDISFQQKCLHRLETLQQRNATIVFVSHDIQTIKNFCSSAIYLRDGEIAGRGNPESVTEAYLKDMHAYRQNSTSSNRLTWKESAFCKDSFGTNNVAIEDIKLLRGSDEADSFYQGDPITVNIIARVGEEVLYPNIFLQLRDYRGYSVYGTDTATAGLDYSLHDGKSGIVGASFKFDVSLAPGQYSFAISINDHMGSDLSIVHLKLIGALPFNVFERGKKFFGVVDLKAKCERIYG